MGKKIKDSDILKAMAMHLDEDSVVFGANGHYSVGGYYDVIGNEYNKQSNVDSADSTEAAELYRTDNGDMIEYLQKTEWIKNI